MKTLQLFGLVVLFSIHTNFALGQNQSEILPAKEFKYFAITEMGSRVKLSYVDLMDVVVEAFEKKNLKHLKQYNRLTLPNSVLDEQESILFIKINIKKLYATFQCAEISLTLKNHRDHPIYFREKICSGIKLARRSKCEEKIKDNLRELIQNIDMDKLVVRKDKFDSTIKLNYIDTKLSKDSIKTLAQKSDNKITGLYESIDSTGSIYNFGIVETDTTFNLILTESNQDFWKPGYLKGMIAKDYAKNPRGEFKIEWYQKGQIFLNPAAWVVNDSILIVQFDEPRLKKTKYFRKLE